MLRPCDYGGAGFVLGSGIGLIGDALSSARHTVYERPLGAAVLNPGEPAPLANAYSSPITVSGRLDPPAWTRQRFRLAVFGGGNAGGGPGSEVEEAMRSAGLTGSSCFFSCVHYPTTTSSMQWGVEAGYQLSRRLGVGLMWMDAGLGTVSGQHDFFRHLTLTYGLNGLAPVLQVHPSEGVTLSFGPALYSLRAGEAEWATPEPTEYTARQVGLLASLHARPLPSFGLMVQYRLVVSSEHVVYELDCSLDIGGLLPMPAWGRWRL